MISLILLILLVLLVFALVTGRSPGIALDALLVIIIVIIVVWWLSGYGAGRAL